MTGRASFSTRLRFPAHQRLLFACLAIASFTIFVSQHASAYVLNGKSWATGSNVVLQLGLGTATVPLSDGSASWNAAVLPAISLWNERIQRIQVSAVMDATPPVSSGDRINSVVFSSTVFGQSFGSGTLAVTYYIMQGANMVEADILFNRAQTFDSYRGSLRFGAGGFAVGDIRRVFLHELGHGIGLNHQEGDNIMASLISNRETLSNDDISGAQAMYGAPAAPTPTPAPTATPAPTPVAGASRLVNISTRMKVGVGADVLIGGFIIQGTQPEQMLLRASGPSLGTAGVKGSMQDPMLELYDSSGVMISQNDDWQSGGQAASITAAGLAPNNSAEAALVATLQPGVYTAMVRGRNNTQGVALVEGYELDAPGSRLVNLSTRGRIGVGDEVLIGGIILQGTANKRVILRAVGPSLAGAIAGALADPVLEVYNSSGQLVASNDNWTTSAQSAEIGATGLAPSNPLESAVVTVLAPGGYTAIVHGANGSTGIGVVEVYDLE